MVPSFLVDFAGGFLAGRIFSGGLFPGGLA
jgi:hypothetical protein